MVFYSQKKGGIAMLIYYALFVFPVIALVSALAYLPAFWCIERKSTAGFTIWPGMR